MVLEHMFDIQGRAAPTEPPTGMSAPPAGGHGYGTHEDELRCQGSDVRRLNGVQVLDPCPCRRYDGPEPLPRAFAPLDLPPAPWT